jgi:PilZ domain
MQLETRSSAASARQYSRERRYPRHFLSAPVTTWGLLNARPQVTRGLTLEISVGGLSAVLCGPPKRGERVSVRLNLLNDVFETLAIVRHSSPARTGFEFLEPSPELLSSIENCIQASRLCPCPQPYNTDVV